MRILVLDQCSSSKTTRGNADSLTLETIDEAFTGSSGLDEGNQIPAADLYKGKQQERIKEAVRILRRNNHKVDRYFISAGFGLVRESEPLPPYDISFSQMDENQMRQRSEKLRITEDLIKLFDTNNYEIAIFALGKAYYKSIDLDRILGFIPDSTMIVLFNREKDEAKRDNVISIPARTEEARENGSTVIGLKGTYLKRFASKLGPDVEELVSDEVVEFCLSKDTTQSKLE